MLVMFVLTNIQILIFFLFFLQEGNFKAHKASKVLILGNMKLLITAGTSRYNDRQIALWDQVRPVNVLLTQKSN